MSCELVLWLLALGALLALGVQLLRFVRADGDLTLLWAEWQGRRPGEAAEGFRASPWAAGGGGGGAQRPGAFVFGPGRHGPGWPLN